MAAETLLKGDKLASEGLPKGLMIAKQKPLSATSAVIILLLILGACLANVVSPYDRLTVSDAECLQPRARCSAVRAGNLWNGCRPWLSSPGWQSVLLSWPYLFGAMLRDILDSRLRSASA
jgi:hypothetical protein